MHRDAPTPTHPCPLPPRRGQPHTARTPPPRPTQLPAIRRWHMPRDSAHAVSSLAATACTPPSPRPAQLSTPRRCHRPRDSVHDGSPHAATARTPPHRAPRSYPRHDGATGHADSAHDVSPHAATACTPPHRAPRSHPRHDGATGHVTRCTPYRHTPRPHARPSPHRAPHSYPRHDGATGHATRRTPYRRTLRPHAHLPTAPHTATRVTTVAQATRLGTRRIATRLDRTHTSPPRLTQLPAIRRWHMPRDSVHDVSPHAAVARQGRLGLLCAPRTAVALHGCSCVATADHEALVALRICCTRRVRKSSGPRRAAAEHDTPPLRAGCRSRGHRVEDTGTYGGIISVWCGAVHALTSTPTAISSRRRRSRMPSPLWGRISACLSYTGGSPSRGHTAGHMVYLSIATEPFMRTPALP